MENTQAITDTSDSDMGHGRVIHEIEDLLQTETAKAAKLTREETIAIVMYTGPAFVLYNAALRRWPADIYNALKDSGNLFPTTIFVLVSAINKLSRCALIPPGTLLYRGLGGTLEFPDRFTRPDADCATPHALGFLEFGFMSTTADKSVAVQYSGVRENRPKAGILLIRPNTVDRGADISQFSQYPGEKEFLFGPYSFVQGDGRQRTEISDGGGVLTVVPVRVNINMKMETVEELVEKKKRMHVASARLLADEVREEIDGLAQAVETKNRWKKDHSCSLQQFAACINSNCNAIVLRHANTDAVRYVNDSTFRSLVTEILNMKMWAKEKFLLWLQDESKLLRTVSDASLVECLECGWVSWANASAKLPFTLKMHRLRVFAC